MSASAFKASYSDWRLVKTRGVVQIIVEVPLAEADAAYEILGGMPNPAQERWIALAAISAEAQPERKDSVSTARAKRPWMDLQPQQQAGIRCGEEAFRTFLKEEYSDDWHEAADDPAACVRLICGVESRAMIGVNQKARVIWRQLDDKFEAWKRVA